MNLFSKNLGLISVLSIALSGTLKSPLTLRSYIYNTGKSLLMHSFSFITVFDINRTLLMLDIPL